MNEEKEIIGHISFDISHLSFRKSAAAFLNENC
jgi:hypothetical protein